MKEGQGILFKNQKKTTSKHPDSVGFCMINGKEMRVAGWTKEGPKGKYVSFQLSEPLVKREEVDELPSGDLPF